MKPRQEKINKLFMKPRTKRFLKEKGIARDATIFGFQLWQLLEEYKGYGLLSRLRSAITGRFIKSGDKDTTVKEKV